MLGTVSYVNKNSGHFIIRDVVGEFSLALVLGKYKISVGTPLSGQIQKIGCSKLVNKTSEEIIPTLILDSHCSEKDVLLKLRKAKRINNL